MIFFDDKWALKYHIYPGIVGEHTIRNSYMVLALEEEKI